jgi:hypothetical protein
MLNMNFEQRVVIETDQQPWIASPHAGVWRKPLARESAERGHATSLVKFNAGASFSEHDHPLGEEILVLSSTFSDHSGDYQAGSYFRNPEGFKHAPFSKEGCVLFVKLHQFTHGDDEHVVIDEYGRYPQGIWVRSPHLSEHFPYVEQETIILVKVGHL